MGPATASLWLVTLSVLAMSCSTAPATLVDVCSTSSFPSTSMQAPLSTDPSNDGCSSCELTLCSCLKSSLSLPGPSAWADPPPMFSGGLCSEARGLPQALTMASTSSGGLACNATAAAAATACYAAFLQCKGRLAESIVGNPKGFSSWCTSWASATHAAWVSLASSGFAGGINASCYNATCALQNLISSSTNSSSSTTPSSGGLFGATYCILDTARICTSLLNISNLPLTPSTPAPFSGALYANQLLISVNTVTAVAAARSAVIPGLPPIFPNATIDDILSVRYAVYASFGIARLLAVYSGLPLRSVANSIAADLQASIDLAPSYMTAGNFTLGFRNATYANRNTAITISVPSVVPAYPLPNQFTVLLSVQGAHSSFVYVVGVISSWIVATGGSTPFDIPNVLGIAGLLQGGVGSPDTNIKTVPQYAVSYTSSTSSSGSGAGGVPLLYFFLALIGAAAMGLCVGLFVARFFLRPPPLPSIKQQLLDVPMLSS